MRRRGFLGRLAGLIGGAAVAPKVLLPKEIPAKRPPPEIGEVVSVGPVPVGDGMACTSMTGVVTGVKTRVVRSESGQMYVMYDGPFHQVSREIWESDREVRKTLEALKREA